MERYESRLEWYFAIFANGIPLFVLAIPFDYFGESEGWCWIQDSGAYFLVGTILRLLTFYVPLWLVVAYNVVIYSNIRRVLQRQGHLMQFPTPDADQIVKRFRWYPWVLALCYAVPTVNRLYQIGTGGEGLAVFGLGVLSVSVWTGECACVWMQGANEEVEGWGCHTIRVSGICCRFRRLHLDFLS